MDIIIIEEIIYLVYNSLYYKIMISIVLNIVILLNIEYLSMEIIIL